MSPATAWILRCVDCARCYGPLEVRYRCECGGTLDVVHDFGAAPGPVGTATLDARRGSFAPADRSGVWRFREWVLPLPLEHLASKPEGNTNLYESAALGAWAGLRTPLRLKHEGENPTGSFKDRGMTVAISVAHALGMAAVECVGDAHMKVGRPRRRRDSGDRFADQIVGEAERIRIPRSRLEHAEPDQRVEPVQAGADIRTCGAGKKAEVDVATDQGGQRKQIFGVVVEIGQAVAHHIPDGGRHPGLRGGIVGQLPAISDEPG